MAQSAPRTVDRQTAVRIVVLAGLYIGAAKFGIELPVAHGVVTPVWVPSGIAIAALVFFGYRLWPGVAIGALVANATSGVSVPVAMAIAVGNTAEALVALFLLRRVRFDSRLQGVRDVIAFVLLAVMAATTVAALNGVTALTVAGEITPGRFGSEWLLWWLGDAGGALLVAPALLIWAHRIKERRPVERPAEAMVLIGALVGVSFWLFLGGSWRYPYLIFPLLVWAALRYTQLGATTAVLVVAALATWGTVEGSLPIGGVTATQSVQILQGLLGVVGVATLMIAATISERDLAETERSALLVELGRQNQIQESLLKALSDLGEGFVVTDRGKLTFANDAYARMTGYSLRELMEFPSLLELSAPEEREALTERLRSRLLGHQVEDHYEATLIRKDGERIACEVSIKLVQTDSGPRIISLVRDVTERKRERTFRENFLAYTAHELRGPMTAISGFAQLMQDRNALSDKDYEIAAERLVHNADTMNERFENLLALARLQQQEISFAHERVELGGVIAAALLQAPPPSSKSVTTEVDGEVWVDGDRGAIEQILVNFLTNAYRYGGANISVAASNSGERAMLSVSDDGPGVPHFIADRLFEPFVRAGSGKEGGAGLGLAMARGLATAAGLQVGYRNLEPQGACFYVDFPAPEAPG